ncbi:endonuclease/exonuclease/phosphatase family protein [Tenuifilum thalassicum]|uniref:Endonuclease/exonuclease/phosphatase domain-containing protein n=1 Tax=Tenuifilum thalassicum TaxID=2590900 RepID=A0A7D3XWG3_9BACT|nr:endonuclease/exonuclease/phosphatase family protein [Tenuifilum thalassicum]QKG80708.1 hypothetical protein FHG85_10670 [Tenuifilum thalassicum]
MLLVRLIHRLLVWFNVLFALALVLTYLSVYVNPENFWFAAVLGLFYPMFLLINLLFLVYWIFRWRKFVFISLIAIILGLNHFNSFIQLPFGKTKKDNADLKVMSYNVNLFRLYSWSDQKASFHDILKYISNNQIDVVCLQEYFTKNDGYNKEDAERISGMRVYPSYLLKRATTAYGLAILTNLPVINKGEIAFSNSLNACMYVDLLTGNDTIRIYNLHLQSTRLKERNFNFLLRNEFKIDSKNYDEFRDLVSRLGVAFQKRAKQVNQVLEHINDCKYPVLICGDFNDSPISYTYQTLTKQLHDTFKDAGIGVETTFSGIWPSYRIDYILRSNHFLTTQYSSPRLNYSDHYPIIVGVKLKR